MKPLQIHSKTRRVKLRLARTLYSEKAILRTLHDYKSHVSDAKIAKQKTHFAIEFKTAKGTNAEFVSLALANHCLGLTQILG